MKKISITILMCISFLTNSFAPLAAQDGGQETLRQRAVRIMPQPSLPSWAKGPGFEAAKKWWKAGRDTSVLDRKEKRAFNRLKKKIKIGAIISAILIVLGGARWHHVRKQRKAAAAEQQRLEAAATKIQALVRTHQARKAAAAEQQRRKAKQQQEAAWRQIGIQTMVGNVMYPISLAATDNTITFSMPVSWIEREKKPPSEGDYLFKIIETIEQDGYSYTAQATDPKGQTLNLQITEAWGSIPLGLEFKKDKEKVSPYSRAERFPLFEKLEKIGTL